MGAPLYVLGVISPGSAPWVLALEGFTLEGARRAIRWQEQGQPDSTRWHVCKRVGPAQFRNVDTGESLEAERSIYTESAWNGFLATWDAD